ncbi:MAG TPA: RNA polymerase subunit sigma-24 [Verrucomicrobiales bacterium]|jgi:RNA polymerase sigma-70 factor (ECF subfamily)|nr:MAG: sigma-70 family RNA polymerase sigma factor [Verrucomicrobiaceae bacterium]HAE18085.1 RNA polymerase subunit sigma-24 [Verrucomicrobiales bacterium]HBF16350.1 RNA polymerase subunit sigma-24 [Verrucomicrobiales bacterium]HBI31114.1 RNA polymerase subunit sigma-24 [Verrucomicrobiales bacterium]HCN80052.1 RNA polymerase subunit sigma-24 [Verrucomicrobiales bacterium]|tara:strand:- start:116 stop:715 length:600 start_codon:yes stop_codon:yes gene_type:complete
MSSESVNESPADTDEVLVARAQSGDTSAFDQLVIRYSPRLYGMIYHMTSNKEDANDLTQDVFAKAYRSLRRFRGRSSFYTWIYAIGTNMTLNFLKKRNRRAAWSLDNLDSGIQNDEAMVDLAHAANPRHQSDLNELQKKLNEALQSLSNRHRAVVTMFDIQGIPHAEISKILKVSEGTVRSRLFYAHRQLQGHLEEFIK